jgi:hypothetical protein
MDSLLVDVGDLHSDGQPHKKACPGCAFRRGNPQNFTDEEAGYLEDQLHLGGFIFCCNHRIDTQGFVLECACWSAKVKSLG